MVGSSYLTKAKSIIAENRFVMLSKSWCPDCHYAYRIWDEYKVTEKMHIIELDKMQNQSEAESLEKAFTEISGIKWVPTLFFNGKYFGTEKDLKKLKSEDKLDAVFKAEGLT